MPTKSTRSAPRANDARLTVAVQNASRSRRIPAAARFRAWIRAAAASGDVTVRLVGVAEGRRINLAYRGKDHATNVLSFAYAEPRAVRVRRTRRVEGDIVLCPPVVAREARAQCKPLEAHYAHLTVHAVLHLRGYEHAHPADAARMERLETRILKGLGIRNPYLV